MLWIKAFHVVFMVTWFSGLFYLPRLFVYHAMAEDRTSIERFKIMERKLYFGITTPGAVLTTLLGMGLYLVNLGAYTQAGWMHAKLALVGLLWVFHFYCGKLLRDFRRDQNKHGQAYYRWINEVPTVLLIAIVILVVVKP